MVDATIVKWGNSQGIRLPKSLLEQAHMQVSDLLTAETDGDCIILRKQFRHRTFEERLAEYDGRIETCDFDWGEPAGKEGL